LAAGRKQVELPINAWNLYTAPMPSHVTHLLLAQQTCRNAGFTRLLEPANQTYLTLGSQGPDLFYHNQRRKPSGLTYGSLMHRHGYGEAVSHMAMWAWENGLDMESWAAAWIIGFATHAVLDRHTHPYINYFSGWVEPGDPHTKQFRSMHPFLERLLDVSMLAEREHIHPNDLDFYALVNTGDDPPPDWVDILAHGLCRTYTVAAGDDLVRDRLQCAYLDSMGYYRFTNRVDETYLLQGIGREERGEIGSRWLSIIHPLEVPASVDVLNLEQAEWTHPCDENEKHTESFVDLFNAALEESTTVAQAIGAAWRNESGQPESRRLEVEQAVGNWNLSDGRQTTRPCRKHHAGPLPLRQVQEEIRQTIRKNAGY